MARWSRGRIAIGAGIAVLLIAAVVALGLIRAGAFRSATPPPSSSSIQATLPASPSFETTAPPSVAPPRPSAAPQPAPSAQPPSPPPAGLPASLQGVDLERIPTSKRVVALTFDAGANNAGLQSILSTLAANRVPATFFLTGAWVNQYPAGVAAIINGGHRIGNHSMTHPSFTTLTDAQIAVQISSAQEVIQAAGADPRPFFRFPSGARNARTIADVNAAGYVAIRWTVDTLGWQGTVDGTRGPGFVTERVMGAAEPGEIVLMHLGSNPDDGSTLDAAALPQVIAQLRSAGYGFVTLDAVVG
jgi:peptidoglycan/xylan/chitin deacetylase (PgdA/CDA1 family)